VIDIDEDVSRKITKMALVVYAVLFFLSPAQPLLCSTLMGLAAIAPILLGPNPLRILGLLAFAVAGYMFWPQYQESKKIPARNEVRQAIERAEGMKTAVAEYVAAQRRLPEADALEIKPPDSDKASYEVLPGGAIRVQMKFAPLAGLSVRWQPTLVMSAVPAGAGVPAPGAVSPAPAPATSPAAPASVAPTEAASASPAVTAPPEAAASGSVPVAAPAPAAPPAAGPAPKITWACISDDIAQSYLPGNCRNSDNLRKAAARQKK